MAESETEPADSIDERAVSLVKSLLMLSQDKSPTFVKDVLDAEGIVDVDAMTILPYVPQDKYVTLEGVEVAIYTALLTSFQCAHLRRGAIAAFKDDLSSRYTVSRNKPAYSNTAKKARYTDRLNS